MSRSPRRDYGASAPIRCPACDFVMLIKSREAHPERGERYERQTFACKKCGATDTRDVFTPAAVKAESPRGAALNMQHTILVRLSTALDDGTVVTGILWMLPSRTGSFEVEYDGVRKTDGRTDYTTESQMRVVARSLLKEMAESSKLAGPG